MEMGGFMGGFYRVSVHISRLAYVNLLWILFTLLGGVVFGLMPATIALFAITRKWVNGEDDFSIFKTYWKYYKAEFLKSNLIGLIFLVISVLIYLNFMLLQADILWMQIVRYVLLLLTVLLIIVALFVFPIYVHFQLKLAQYFRNALFLGLAYPFHTILMGVGILIVQAIIMKIPGLIPFFSVSVISYFVMAIANSVFIKAQKKNQEKHDLEMQIS